MTYLPLHLQFLPMADITNQLLSPRMFQAAATD